MKELKQRIRDIISPDRDLGHSDVISDRPIRETPETDKSAGEVAAALGEGAVSTLSPHVSILYCPECKWLFRAAWFAQELLSTFEDDPISVSLVPSRDVVGTFVSAYFRGSFPLS